MKKQNSKIYSTFTSSAYLTESEDEDQTIPEERDWKQEIKVLKKKTGEFNINNYAHVLKPEEQA